MIPVLNEEKNIENLIYNLKQQTYPKDCLEYIFIDGHSKDSTVEKIKEYSEEAKIHFRILKNKKKITPVSLNLGIDASEGEFIVRIDAHSEYNNDYIFEGIRKLLENKQIVAVGGYLYPKETTNLRKRTLSRVFFSPLISGFAKYRKNHLIKLEDTVVDTIPYGIFRKKDLLAIEGFNTNLVRGQDIDLFYRLKKKFNGIVLINQKMQIYYNVKENDAFDILKRHYKQGKWVFRRTNGIMPRHYLPLVVLFLLFFFLVKFSIPIVYYFLFYLAIVFFSYLCTIQKSIELMMFPYAAFLHFMAHLGYIFGLLCSLIEMLLKKSLRFKIR